MEILELIDRIEDLVEESSSLPFSKKVMVDSEALFFILKEMRESIPEEIKQAEWIQEEKDRILNDATKDANQILEQANSEALRIKADAELKFEKLISESDVTLHAENRANEILMKAEQNAKTIRIQTNTYVDDVLSKTQEKLRDLITMLDNNRSELRK
ncbi:MAG: ATPase [Peptoniphilaceae bacterium]|uniref:ATPase n=1 Tax=Parvimonas sp. TaxID=1944660 RepID=UPI0025D78A77|nr:ATPase [Parvimonas sp.]MCI5997507.1 ATPase [Parvimonas sp.]MDD7764616.1 ATPase [Peptoniphilaceae bacterium]MDY3050592.1 ATPase [Parvimonas sp.]